MSEPEQAANDASKYSKLTDFVHNLRTPISFLTLTLIVVEGVLATAIGRVTPHNEDILVLGMIGFVIVAPAAVIILAILLPEALVGKRKEAPIQPAAVADPTVFTARLDAEIVRLRAQCSKLKKQIDELTPLRSQIIACLGAGESKLISTLIGDLGAHNPEKKDALVSQLGKLVDEGRVGPDPHRTTGYYMLIRGP